MSEKVTIAGHGARIELIVHEYENAIDVSADHWLDCSISLAVGPFRGAFKCALTARDLQIFNDQLKPLGRSLAGTAELTTEEETIHCTISMTTLGHALISGTVRVRESVEAELSFSFESDQSFLCETGAELEALLEKFPAKS